ncbi:hypothetical protein UFOVP1361_28 [uncultured Caudovirales phage]|uniref:Uncharacterized protein n=1 Tax=uncultured Caudovirales phage TaxID=2100421 RepID=A0A6J5S2U7_9CAUD|nr:hypothetical protein UFOVP1361_28 [uncultured Caudovirales phage]
MNCDKRAADKITYTDMITTIIYNFKMADFNFESVFLFDIKMERNRLTKKQRARIVTLYNLAKVWKGYDPKLNCDLHFLRLYHYNLDNHKHHKVNLMDLLSWEVLKPKLIEFHIKRLFQIFSGNNCFLENITHVF